jgi:(E)-4-hydroxy-3-methylbut-2-enyl-diphosphate synthase
LLEDGIGDTIRVSLTEDPEFEVPVARKLVARYSNRTEHQPIKYSTNPTIDWNPYDYRKRNTHEITNIGGTNVPRVVADFSLKTNIKPSDLTEVGHIYDAKLDKWHMADLGCDYIHFGENTIDFMLPNGVKGMYEAATWNTLADKANNLPVFGLNEYLSTSNKSDTLNFIRVTTDEVNQDLAIKFATDSKVVLLLSSNNQHAVADLRNAFFTLSSNQSNTPVFVERSYQTADEEEFMLHASTDCGSLLIDGFGDGVMISNPNVKMYRVNQIAFGILQAGRARITKTEYISCPSCGRTLFDLQETTAMIRKETDHLKGVKIAIMGCIVNGPGEMADADYGYVGSGVGKITLYRGKEVVKKGIEKETAVKELIGLIRDDGKWIEK